MTEEGKDYNGSSAILERMSDLLKENTIPVNSAIRLMLEAQQHAIKEMSGVKKSVKELEGGKIKDLEEHWTNKVSKRSASIAFLVLYSFAISDIRIPFWDMLDFLKNFVLKLLF